MDAGFATAFVEDAIRRSVAGQSKCSDAVLWMEGMSGRGTRHLYNNMCALAKPDGSPTRYLEVGCWKGSSTAAALYANPDVRATVIDNWSEFGGPKLDFEHNMRALLGADGGLQRALQVIEEDALHLTTRLAHAPYDIYLYDGQHDVLAHELAITRMWEHLADTCIIMVDDYNWEDTRKGTAAALERIEARGGTVAARFHVGEGGDGDAQGFWNGCGIFVVTRSGGGQ